MVAARAGNQREFTNLTEPYRRELQVHCYRILGSLQDAEDIVQETMLRAWRRIDTYEGRASLRAWLYKIATHACLDALDRRPRRVLPATTHAASDPGQPPAPPTLEPIWLEPLPDDLVADSDAGPEARYTVRESVTLAFLAALQLLPPRQRAVLILRDVLDWSANEVAELLDMTVPAVNSALHRARATLARHYRADTPDTLKPPTSGDRLRALLDRYVRAWENADVAGLTALLKEDARFAMPPTVSWYHGRDAIGAFAARAVFTPDARGRFRLQATRANDRPAFAVYQRDAGGTYQAFGIQVLTFAGDELADVTTFVDPALFPRFGLPQTLAG
jgi:RNA polymerase sigma-70 factor (ECF subfamily)